MPPNDGLPASPPIVITERLPLGYTDNFSAPLALMAVDMLSESFGEYLCKGIVAYILSAVLFQK